jgi:flagellin-like hook-associated protein FlgL
MSKGSDEPISLTLRRGAQGAAAAVQSLNAGISYINIAEQFTSSLLDVVNEVDTLVTKAGKGNITPSNARLYKDQFDRLSAAYTKVIKSSVVKGRDLLNVEEMKNALLKAGLNVDEITELNNAFKRVTSFSMVELNDKGQVLSKDDIIPPEAFYRALRQATRDPEEPVQSDDGSVAFASSRQAVKEIKDHVMENLKSLSTARDLVEKNLKLVRATGFAFLNVSNEVGDSDTVDDVALRVRGAIRSGARDVLSEAQNLQGILQAGFRLLQDASGNS